MMFCNMLAHCVIFFHSVNRITDERGNGHRPNLAGTGRGDPLEVVDFWR